MYDKIKLISVSSQADALGVMGKTETISEVLAAVTSVTRSEWFNGARAGLNPQYVFRVFLAEYSGQDIVEYKSLRYTIYRTYIDGEFVELSAEKRKGNE